ncbi:MAG: CPBP family intramembrane metalloprotease [Flaviflexus sp.]|uniref:CPBP family intramembrane glutamic endopeptidase n=1 Tax=Flaviflexus sp. TaxID=1969482 RepID=UPI00352DEBB3
MTVLTAPTAVDTDAAPDPERGEDRAVEVSRRPSREVLTVISVIGLLAAVNFLAHFTPLSMWFFTVPVGVGVILAVGKAMGHSWSDIGISRKTLKRGLKYGGIAGGVVLGAVLLGVLLPITRDFFLNDSYSSARKAVLAAFVLIPIQTVLPEELAFRGILHSSLQRLGGIRAVLVVGSVLFGLWHVASSLNLTAGNAGLTQILGSGTLAQWVGIVLAVIATSLAGAAFTWLRHRSNSVIAPIGLHWALNACGALAAAFVFQL